MTEHAHNAGHAAAHAHPNYMAIFWWLLGLTIAEVIVAIPRAGDSYPQVVKGAMLVALAVTKAALVAMYFMHLRFERRTLALIAMTPMVLCVFLLFMLLPDSGLFGH
jgi:caa(3)-type oxidase subunit IV